MTIFGELWVNSVAGAMTLFEYISVAVSIIIALTIAEGLRGLRSALDSSRRYSIHNAGHKKNRKGRGLKRVSCTLLCLLMWLTFTNHVLSQRQT